MAGEKKEPWGSLADLLEEHGVELEARARGVSETFWDEQKEENKKLRLQDRGTMGCRIRVKGENASIYAEWYKTFWVKSGGKSKPLGKYIKKSKTDQYGYGLPTLERMSKPCEKERVVRAEKAFRVIREQNHCLAQLRKYAQQMVAAEQVWEEEICQGEK